MSVLLRLQTNTLPSDLQELLELRNVTEQLHTTSAMARDEMLR